MSDRGLFRLIDRLEADVELRKHIVANYADEGERWRSELEAFCVSEGIDAEIEDMDRWGFYPWLSKNDSERLETWREVKQDIQAEFARRQDKNEQRIAQGLEPIKWRE